MQLKMLVLPAPLGPMMAKNSPRSTSRLTPARAATPPKLRCRLSRARSPIRSCTPSLSKSKRGADLSQPAIRVGASYLLSAGRMGEKPDNVKRQGAVGSAMNRRTFLLALSSVLAEPLALEALRDLGYVEGQSRRLEVRSADNNLDRLPELAVALAQAKVDLIVAVSPPAIRAASQATKTIPIVMAFWGGEGLLESGVVTSFAGSGTNVTGIYMFAAELDAKRLGLLLEAMPSAKRVGVLNPGLGWGDFAQVRAVAQAAK